MYKIPATDKNGMFTNWFSNAMHEALSEETVYRTYELAFMIHFGFPITTMDDRQNQSIKWFVNFPSESEATMFLLRWS